MVGRSGNRKKNMLNVNAVCLTFLESCVLRVSDARHSKKLKSVPETGNCLTMRTSAVQNGERLLFALFMLATGLDHMR